MSGLNIICGLIGVLGLILIGIGRRMLFNEVSGLGLFWRISARLPMGEILILSRFWETAKSGAFTSLAGLILLIPWGALQLYEAKLAPVPESRSAHMDNDHKAFVYNSMKSYHDSLIQAKEAKCAKLNKYLSDWFSSLQARRRLVLNSPPQLDGFNQEAAAYSALNALTKNELAELTAMRAKPYEFQDLKAEDFDQWLEHEDLERKRLASHSDEDDSFLESGQR